MRKLSKAEAGKLGAAKSKATSERKKQERADKYKKDPARCKKCNNEFEYEDRHKKFCNNSCAASYNNVLREREVKVWICLNCETDHEAINGRIGKYCNTK